jgi:hypothetical protein
MPRTSAFDYEPCPACGGRRWRGHQIPLCDACVSNVLDPAWLTLRSRLIHSNASLSVMVPFDQALVADCKERLASKASPNPHRR